LRNGITGSLVGLALCASISAQVTKRVSVATGGVQGNGGDSNFPSISADGRYVAFGSRSNNLVPGDTNSLPDVFVHDRQSGVTERISIATGGQEGNGDSAQTAISADGRYVAFTSTASNLVSGDTNGVYDVFVHDRQIGVTERISVATDGSQANDRSETPSISADGRYIVFESRASNLVPANTLGMNEIFVRDRLRGTTDLISIAANGSPANGYCAWPSVSSDGRYTTYWSHANNLVPGDLNMDSDVFVRDIRSGTTELVSLATSGVQGNNSSAFPSISANGRYVAFGSTANTLVPGDVNVAPDVFVRDRESATTEHVSVASDGTQANGTSGRPRISADGRFVVFFSEASNLVLDDTNGFDDVFVRDRMNGTTDRVSVATSGAQGTFDSGYYTSATSACGRYLAFESKANNLVVDDDNGTMDVFVRDLDTTNFVSLCDPGIDDVMDCPCSNPPAGQERGCDNSSTPGGASLTASGAADLSFDSVVFTTTSEKPTSLSIVMQGNGLRSGGSAYGQGVGCVGGTIIRRLYTKAASGGSISAPDFGVGDQTVSARSAAKGDVIQAAESRWYLVYYRDSNVLGGCPGSSTFNATQTGQVTWSP
jgi:Tol biopolymer transport system component